MFKVLLFSFIFAVGLILSFLYKKIKNYLAQYIQNINDEISDIEKMNFDSISILQQTKDEYSNMDNVFLNIYSQKIESLKVFTQEMKNKINQEFEEKQKNFLQALKTMENSRDSQVKIDAIDSLMDNIKSKLQ